MTHVAMVIFPGLSKQTVVQHRGLTCMFVCELHHLVGCIITGCIFLWCWLNFVSGCAFICSRILHDVTSSWEQVLDFVSVAGFIYERHIWELWLWQGQEASWDSAWNSQILADHQLGIDCRLIDYWLLINRWSMSCSSLTVIPQAHIHCTNLVKATEVRKCIQIW